MADIRSEKHSLKSEGICVESPEQLLTGASMYEVKDASVIDRVQAKFKAEGVADDGSELEHDEPDYMFSLPHVHDAPWLVAPFMHVLYKITCPQSHAPA